MQCQDVIIEATQDVIIDGQFRLATMYLRISIFWNSVLSFLVVLNITISALQ